MDGGCLARPFLLSSTQRLLGSKAFQHHYKQSTAICHSLWQSVYRCQYWRQILQLEICYNYVWSFFLSLFVLSGVAPLQSGNLRDPLEAGRTLIQFCLLGQKTRGEIMLQKSSWKIERYCVKFTLISQVPGLLTWRWIPQPTFLYVKFKSYKNPVFPQCIVSKQVQTVDETLRVVFQIVLRHLLTKY